MRALRRLFPAVLLVAAGCAAPERRPAQDYGLDVRRAPFSRFSAGIGYRGMDDSWGPFDDQLAFQFGGQHEWPSFPLGIEYALGFAGTDAHVSHTNVTSSTFDLSVGPTHTFPLGGDGRWFANVGGGAYFGWTQEDSYCGICGSDDDAWFAGYVHASLFWRAGWDFDFGFDVRWVRGEDVEISGDDRTGESLQVLFVSGFAW